MHLGCGARQDQVRFGGLLFSEKSYDYEGWAEQQKEEAAEKAKLLGGK